MCMSACIHIEYVWNIWPLYAQFHMWLFFKWLLFLNWDLNLCPRLDIVTALILRTWVSWDVILCSGFNIYQIGRHCVTENHQDLTPLHSTTYQKTRVLNTLSLNTSYNVRNFPELTRSEQQKSLSPEKCNMNLWAYTGGSQLDKLQKLHFNKQLRQEPCLN